MVIIIHIKIETTPEILKGSVALNSRNQCVVQSKLWEKLHCGCGGFLYSNCDAFVDSDLHACPVTTTRKIIKKHLVFCFKASNDSGIVCKLKPVSNNNNNDNFCNISYMSYLVDKGS